MKVGCIVINVIKLLVISVIQLIKALSLTLVVNVEIKELFH